MNNLLINPKTTIQEAMIKLNANAKRHLIVISDRRIFKGILTDGDIRRSLLKGNSLEEQISKIYNKKAFFIFEKDIYKFNIKNIFQSKKILMLPILDQNKKIKKIIFFDEFLNSNKLIPQNNLTVVIMAGGEGTRLKPYTNFLPKALIPINQKPMIEHIIDFFKLGNIKNFILSTNYQNDLLQEYFKKRKDISISIIKEKKPLGTIGSLAIMKKKIKDDFFVINCDVLVNLNPRLLYEFHQKRKNIVTVVTSVKKNTIPYGVCKIDKKGDLKKIIEKPTYDMNVNVGFYLMKKKILNLFSKEKFLGFNDLVDLANKKKYKIGVYPVSDDGWHDVGEWKYYNNVINNKKNN